MNIHEIKLLQKMSGYPALTITLPTHRTSPDNRQDPIRVSNLVAEAHERLLAEFSKREIEPLLTRLDKLVESIDYRYSLDGLVLFVNRDFARAFFLPFSLKERVVVDERFFTRDLIYAMHRTPRYWVLVLSEQPTRLFEGSKKTLIEVSEEGFPLTHTGPGGEMSLPGGFGVNKSQHRDERHRQFFRQVDAAFRPFILDDPLPLMVVGVDRYLAFFREVSDHSDAISATLRGSHDSTPAHELGDLVWPVVKQALAEERQKYLEDLDQAVGERKFASTIGEVWRMAQGGRGRLLLVEEDFHYPARVDGSGLHISPADELEDPGVLDDAVDEVVNIVLDKGGKVVFVENGQLEAHSRIALILRY
ncbi:MAG TPA: hypothetical protein VLM80_13440 [Anaerolineales bacterium]|nr:hypothetical protein [Anaerolineales bacterium]